MTQEEATELLTQEKEIIALDLHSYVMFLSLGLALLHQGVDVVAKVKKGWRDAEVQCDGQSHSDN